MRPIPSILELLPLSNNLCLIPGFKYIFRLEQCLFESLFRWALFEPETASSCSPKKNLKRLETAARELRSVLGGDNLDGLSSEETFAAVKKKVAAIETALAVERKLRTDCENQQIQLERFEEECHRQEQQISMLRNQLLLSKQQLDNLEVVRRKVGLYKKVKEAIRAMYKIKKSDDKSKDGMSKTRHTNGKDHETDSID